MIDESSEPGLDAEPSNESVADVAADDEALADQIDPGQIDPDQIDPGQIDPGQIDSDQIDALEDAQRAMDEARARLAEVPAEVVVTNHVMGLYELAAIHLSATPPDLVQSALAIDAVACLVDGLGERLGDDAGTMRDALNNIRLAFVQIQGSAAPDDVTPDDTDSP